MVVTGLGIVGPLGIGWEDTWRAALAGALGRRPDHPLRRLEPGLPDRVRGPDFEPGDFVDRRSARRMDRASQMAVAAARLALDDAALEIDGDGYRAGTVIATGNGGSETFEEHHRALLDRGPERSSPRWSRS